jgi:Fuc2NAc and GlcNAc transferase
MIWSFFIALVTSLVVTGMVRHYALRAGLMDVPNKRSSHQIATPRGGGLAIVGVFLAGMLVLCLLDVVPVPVFFGIFSGGLLTAGIGFADDLSHVSARWRLAVHFLAATVILFLIGGLPAIQIGSAVVDLGVTGDILAAVFIVWMINLFNFMDGIDGIAAVEVICVAGGAWLISSIPEGNYVSAILGLLISATFGFLIWNWPPAKIFMGDVGSGFVGFALAAIALDTSALGIIPIWSWLILGGVFLVDATVTLAVRVLTGQTWYEAHKSHAYQKATRRLHGHASVTLIDLLLNCLWLLPIAWLTAQVPANGWWLTILAWAPLTALAFMLRAGQVEARVAKG